MRSALAAALALLLAACASAPPASIARAVEADLKAEAGDAPYSTTPSRLLTAVSVSEDGTPDWRVDYGKSEMAGRWCGTGGCRQALWVSHAGRHVLAFDAQALELTLATVDGQRVLDLNLHGTHCNASGADPCHRRFVWDTRQGRFVEAPNASGRGVIEAPVFQVVPIEQPQSPPEVWSARESVRADCARLGGEVSDGEPRVLSIPDIDGDGRRDWVLDSIFAACLIGDRYAPFHPVTRIYLDRAEAHVEVYAEADLVYELDVSASPARLLRISAGPACGGLSEPRCPRQTLTLGADGRLSPGAAP